MGEQKRENEEVAKDKTYFFTLSPFAKRLLIFAPYFPARVGNDTRSTIDDGFHSAQCSMRTLAFLLHSSPNAVEPRLKISFVNVTRGGSTMKIHVGHTYRDIYTCLCIHVSRI